MKEQRSLVIRADADVRIGTGHVMRCLALAQAWQDAGGRAIFAMAKGTPTLESRLATEGAEVVRLQIPPGKPDDAPQAAGLAKERGARWVAVDGYHFGYEYQLTLKEHGLRVLFIDDHGHAGRYCADIVLNQNISADESLYADRSPYTRLLLGPRYVLLRREFWSWRRWKREIPDIARKVLVTMGGSDPENVTLKVIQALEQASVEGLEAVAVVGGSNPYYEELRSAVQSPATAVRLKRNVANMPELMAWADVAVSAGGSTCWELAFMGLPSVVLVMAENQERAVEVLAARRVMLSIGHAQCARERDIAKALAALLPNHCARETLSKNGRQLVDGLGALRVAEMVSSN